MALIFMPGQFNDRADFYHQTSALVTAGFGLPNALEHLRKNPPARGFRRPLTEILAHLQDGCTFAEALRNTGAWMPEFDTALLEAGEKSGRLDSCLKLLANYYQERMRLARTVLGDMAYPAFLLHAALFLLGLPQFVLTGNWQRYLLLTFGILIPIYLAVLVGIYLFQGSRGIHLRLVLEKLVGMIPLIGRARKHLALARLAMALESLLSAGVYVINAWELSASASGSPTLQKEVFTWRPQIEAGVRPSELLHMSSRFPDVFTNLYSTGEASGRLDDHLSRIHTFYHEAGTHTLRQVATWAPRFVYLGIAGYIAYKVVSFWMGYFQQITEFSTF
jgi:type IV pilus assembly protein PilC